MDWEDVKEAAGCLAWVIVIGLIIAVCTVGPGILNALQRWSESL
jgi:hypothetical protein